MMKKTKTVMLGLLVVLSVLLLPLTSFAVAGNFTIENGYPTQYASFSLTGYSQSNEFIDGYQVEASFDDGTYQLSGTVYGSYNYLYVAIQNASDGSPFPMTAVILSL